MDMTGNTIIITGGGSGIGRGFAQAFHAAGNKVIITGRRRDALEATAAGHPGISVETLDVADAHAIKLFAAKVVADHPELNAVVHNAGIMIQEKVTDGLDLDVVESTIATNLLGPIRLTAALLPHLRRQPTATILTVSSGLAFVPLTATPTYSATKAAIHSYSQSLRTQLAGTSIQVIELAPPAVATDLMPGHAQNPRSMPLDAYIEESMALLRDDPAAAEILVNNVKPLRHAEANGQYAQIYGMLNGAH